jgi:hypothetical protein
LIVILPEVQEKIEVANAYFSWDNAWMNRRYLIVAGSLTALACLVLGVLAMLPSFVTGRRVS